ncbi:MAG TPA: peptidylprolyl isomerase [Bacteroidales bacterium]|nr:peptidylprolyl isomerase [Bacteroidales bacterium]HRX96391.1 peptidylprolyl isomerase [Bacteroidales bacterium]
MIKRKNSQNIVISLPVLALIIIMTIFSTNISAQDQEAPEGVIIDEVIATVGGNIVQYSEIEAQYLQYTMQEGVPADPQKMKCDMLENMIYQKLLLNQAELDSVEVTDGQVESELDRRLRYYISLLGSKEKFEEFYQKSVVEFKEELREQVREMMLVENVQQSITTDVKITPTEIRQFYKDIPEDSVPFINSEVRLAQIVKLPPVNDEEIERVKNKLQEIRYRVLNGENFATLAILYSEDPGSSKQGGELGLFGRGEMYPEFEAAAFSLKEKNEVSDIIKTDAGFHILQLIERRGEYVNVRHILLRPKVSPLDLAKAKVELDSIANLIEEGKFTFDEAVQEFSEDPSKNNGGLVLNPMTNTSLFESDQLDPKVFFVIDKLEVGEISAPVQFQTQEGKDAYRILYVKDRTEPHKANLKQDYDKIQEWALEKKKQDELLKWVNEKVKNTYVKVNENYQNCTFSKNWTL